MNNKILNIFKNTRFALFFKANFLLTTLLFTAFLFLNEYNSLYTLFLTFLGAVSTVATLYIIFFIISLFLRPFRKAIFIIMGIIFIITDISIIVDFFIYKIYHFHINAIVINIITSPDALDSIQLGIAPVVAFIIFILFLIGFEFFIYQFLKQKDDKYLYEKNKFYNKVMILPLFLIILFEKIIYGYHDLENDGGVLTKFKVIPLYQPLTYTRLARDYFGYIPKPKVVNQIDVQAAINYPLEAIEIKQPNKVNIFIFASDAVRDRDVNKYTAPNITTFSKEAYRFHNHRSGGNATRFGIFSLLYGVNATYWFNFLAATRGPILIDTLKQLDYNFSIISSTNTNWPEFRKTAYIDIQEYIQDKFAGSPWEKDKKSTQAFIKFIQEYNTSKPLFSFMFMDAPHGYVYPPDENIFHAGKRINYLTVSKDSEDLPSIYAGYKNAIHYNDKLFGKMIQLLKDRGLYDNSIIIYTSDHGEEFYEYGSFGHNNTYSKAQTNSVFMIKLPKGTNIKLPKHYENMLTSHVDIVPTLMSFIGVVNPTKTYSNGYNLLDEHYRRKYAFCATTNTNAIITSKYTYVFSNMPDKMFQNEIHDTKTYKIVEGVDVPSSLLIDVMNENSRFLKH